MNRKNRKLKEIRQSNYLTNRGVLYDTFKIIDDIPANLLELQIGQQAAAPKWAKSKFNLQLIEVDQCFESDDFTKDLITIRRKFLVTPKKIREKAKKTLRFLK